MWFQHTFYGNKLEIQSHNTSVETIKVLSFPPIFQDKCHKCVTRIPLIEENRGGPSNIHCVTTETENCLNILTQMCNCNSYIVCYTK